MARRRLTDREIAAYTILGEAGGEGPAGMAAVAHVLLNRAQSGRFPSTIGAVATQHSSRGVYQFTTWSPSHGNSPTRRYPRDSEEFQAALSIVDRVLAGETDPTGGALHYYANSGPNAIRTPTWFPAEAVGGTQQIGNHLFASTGPVVPVPQPITQGIQNLRAGLTRGGLELPRPLLPSDAPASAAAQGGLITRRVQTIPVRITDPEDFRDFMRFSDAMIDSIYTMRRPAAAPVRPPVSGLNLPAVPAAINQTRVNLQDLEAARQSAASRAVQSITRGVQTTTVRADGTTISTPRAGTAEMPRNYTPSVMTPREVTTVRTGSLADREAVRQMSAATPSSVTPRPPVGSLADREAARQVAASTGPRIVTNTVPRLTPAMQRQTVTRMVSRTITVENPEWGQVNPDAIARLQDIHDREEARRMAAQIPRFITKTIEVPETRTIMVPVPGVRQNTVPVAPPPPPPQITGSATGNAYNIGERYTAGAYVYEATPTGFVKVGPSGPGTPSQRYNQANSGSGSVAAMEAWHGGGSSNPQSGGPAVGGSYGGGT